MTDKEIIKALECCKKNDCDNCPNDFGNCYANLARYALDLINRQQAEIERLTVNMNAFGLAVKVIKERADNAINEFAERLTHNLVINNGENTDYFDFAYTLETIDTVKNEMTGETKTADSDFPKDYSYGY